METFPHCQPLILTYKKDLEWLPFCLRSMKRFVRGFLPPVIVCPTQDKDATRRIVEEHYPTASVEARPEPRGLGQLFSQVSKCEADLFCPDADVIFFVDSDFLFTGPASPEIYFSHGKPIMCYNSYAHLAGSPVCMWQPIVSANLGWQVENDYMRRPMMAYPRELFKPCRGYIERLHRKDFREYVYGTKKNTCPQNFCESNVLGAFAHRHMFELYHWSCLDNVHNGWPNPVVQFWSHGGLNNPFPGWFHLDPMFEGCRTPREAIERVLR